MQIKTLTTLTAAHWQLLLRADPSEEVITQYLPACQGFTITCQGQLAGIILLLPHSSDILEIKNLAVDADFENHHLATRLIEFAKKYAVTYHYRELQICTGSTSFKQLYLYQKCGFRMKKIIPDFFIDNYQQPIYENNLRLYDLVVLTQPC